jgi:polysaccharide biosynthesis/export protein
MTRTASFAAAAAVVLAACAGGPLYDYRREPDPRKREYVIGVADTLKVTVWKSAELSSEARVRPDGTITLPLIGDLQAAGHTPTDLNREVTRRLATYVKEEHQTVTIAVVEVNSYHFTVSGNVEHGGVYSSRSYVTVAEAIALAGGLNKFASERRVLIVRTEGRLRRIPIDYTRVVSGDHPEENLSLLAGDTVFVP